MDLNSTFITHFAVFQEDLVGIYRDGICWSFHYQKKKSLFHVRNLINLGSSIHTYWAPIFVHSHAISIARQERQSLPSGRWQPTSAIYSIMGNFKTTTGQSHGLQKGLRVNHGAEGTRAHLVHVALSCIQVHGKKSTRGGANSSDAQSLFTSVAVLH